MPATTHLDLNRSAVSRYLQLATLFKRRIETGEWPVGHQIPTVDELAKSCGVARATIRQALDVLSDEQLIERFRAKGTFVKRGLQDDLWCAIPTDWSGLLRPSADDAKIELLSGPVQTVGLPIHHDKGRAEEHYAHFRRRHWRQGSPFLIADLYIGYSIREKVSRRDLKTKVAMLIATEVLDGTVGDAQHTMTIGSADPVSAELLSMPLNAPVAHVRREVVDTAGNLVLVSDGVYRGDVVKIDIKLR